MSSRCLSTTSNMLRALGSIAPWVCWNLVKWGWEGWERSITNYQPGTVALILVLAPEIGAKRNRRQGRRRAEQRRELGGTGRGPVESSIEFLACIKLVYTSRASSTYASSSLILTHSGYRHTRGQRTWRCASWAESSS
jgi:hypothetical protein